MDLITQNCPTVKNSNYLFIDLYNNKCSNPLCHNEKYLMPNGTKMQVCSKKCLDIMSNQINTINPFF